MLKRLIISALFLSAGILNAEDCNLRLSSTIKEHHPTTAISFKKGSTLIDVDEITSGFRKAVNKNFEIKQLPVKENLSWKGPELPEQFKGSVRPFKETFSKANLDYELAEQGRTPVEIFSNMVFIIGIEQAFRHVFHARAIQDGFKKLTSDFLAQSASPTRESLKAIHESLAQFSKSLKPVTNPPSGILGNLEDWGKRIDYENVKIDVPESSFSTGTNWNKSDGKPFKTMDLVKTLKKEFDKLYTLESKAGDDAFTWYVSPKNFATFTSSGDPLMKGFQGSEQEYLIYKQLEAGMQQGLRYMNNQSTMGPIQKMDFWIHMLESSLKAENADIAAIHTEMGATLKSIQAFIERK